MFSSSGQPWGHSPRGVTAPGAGPAAAFPSVLCLFVVELFQLHQLLPTAHTSPFSSSKHCWEQSKHSWCLPTAAPGPALPPRTAHRCSLTSALGTAFPKSSSSSHSWGLKLPCQPSHSISYWIFWGNINAGRRWLPLWQQHPPSLVLQAHCPHTSCAPDSDLLFAKMFPGKGCKTLTQGNHGVTVPGILQGMCRCGR